MLENAKLHTSELQTLFHKIWYDPKYQYYFGSDYRWSYSQFDNGDGDSARHREFVSLDRDGKVIGYVGYMINPQLRLANNFGAINFTDGNKLTFAHDLKQVIDDIFVKFGMETLEFSVICGNPIERSYDNAVKRAGGKILCKRHARAQDISGNFCDDKVYEITASEYFGARSKVYPRMCLTLGVDINQIFYWNGYTLKVDSKGTVCKLMKGNFWLGLEGQMTCDLINDADKIMRSTEKSEG